MKEVDPASIDASVRSDRGCARDTNEDRARLVVPHDPAVRAAKGVLVVVADGMGGHASGEVASQHAVDAVHRAYYEHADDIPEALAFAFREANRLVFEEASRDTRLQGMGTTCTALVVRGSDAYWAHVGDTRLYLVRQGVAYQLTEDHSAVARLVAEGVLTRGEARRHPDRNVILRALGTHPDVEVAVARQPMDLRAGDRLLVVSDGLSDLVEDDEMASAAGGGSAASACDALVAVARARGGHDNITAAVVACGVSREAEGEPRTTATWRRDS